MTTEDQLAKIKSKLKAVSNIDFDYRQTLILSRWSCTDNANNGSNARFNKRDSLYSSNYATVQLFCVCA